MSDCSATTMSTNEGWQSRLRLEKNSHTLEEISSYQAVDAFESTFSTLTTDNAFSRCSYGSSPSIYSGLTLDGSDTDRRSDYDSPQSIALLPCNGCTSDGDSNDGSPVRSSFDKVDSHTTAEKNERTDSL